MGPAVRQVGAEQAQSTATGSIPGSGRGNPCSRQAASQLEHRLPSIRELSFPPGPKIDVWANGLFEFCQGWAEFENCRTEERVIFTFYSEF